MESRIAIITGATSGIGKATALLFAKKGFRLVLNSRNKTALDALLTSVKVFTEAAIVCGNIIDSNVTNTCVTICHNEWNEAPSILVACAGRGLPGTIISSDETQWNNLIQTNIVGLLNQLRSVSVAMLKDMTPDYDLIGKPKDIVVIGSNIGRNVSPFNSVYGATKFAAHGLTEALRRELGPKGIRVTLIEPGVVSTNFQASAGYDLDWFKTYSEEIGPLVKSGEVADVIYFVVSFPGNVNIDNISIRPTRQSYP